MREPRFLTGWLLLGLVVVFGVGGAVLGVSQAPSGVPLPKAVANTLKASGYTQVVTESTLRETRPITSCTRRPTVSVGTSNPEPDGHMCT